MDLIVNRHLSYVHTYRYVRTYVQCQTVQTEHLIFIHQSLTWFRQCSHNWIPFYSSYSSSLQTVNYGCQELLWNLNTFSEIWDFYEFLPSVDLFCLLLKTWKQAPFLLKSRKSVSEPNQIVTTIYVHNWLILSTIYFLC